MKAASQRCGIKCQEGKHIFAVYFWHSEGWNVRNDALMSAVLKRVVSIGSHWIVRCDANMDPTTFAGSDLVKDFRAKVKARKRRVLCKGHSRSGHSKTLDHFVVSESLQG